MEKFHTIYYYDLFNQTQNETTAQILKTCFGRGIDIYTFHISGKKYSFDIMELDDDHCFGRLSRFDDYKESLTTIKTKKDEQPLNPEDYIFEKFTFFYIKISTETNTPTRLSTINNSGINIEKCLQAFFLEKYSILPIIIYPTLSTDINTRINKLSEVTKLECTFSDTTTANNQTSFNNIFNFGCYLKNVSIKTSFREKKPHNLNAILENANLRYKKLKISGKSPDGPDTIDVLKQILIKKSKIETRSISVRNYEPIKKALNNFSDL